MAHWGRSQQTGALQQAMLCLSRASKAGFLQQLPFGQHCLLHPAPSRIHFGKVGVGGVRSRGRPRSQPLGRVPPECPCCFLSLYPRREATLRELRGRGTQSRRDRSPVPTNHLNAPAALNPCLLTSSHLRNVPPPEAKVINQAVE